MNTNKPSRWILTSIALGMVALIIVVVAIILIASTQYKKPIHSMVELYNTKSTDVDSYSSILLPKFATTAYKSVSSVYQDAGLEDLDTFEQDLQNDLTTLFQDFSNAYGDDYQITYEIRSKEELMTDQLSQSLSLWKGLVYQFYNHSYSPTEKTFYIDLLDMMEDENNIDFTKSQRNAFTRACINLAKNIERMNISEGYRISLRYTIEGSAGKEKGNLSFNILKIGGRWYLDYMSYLSEQGTYDTLLLDIEQLVDTCYHYYN